MKMKKKLIGCLLSGLFLSSLVSCGQETQSSSPVSSKDETVQSSETPSSEEISSSEEREFIDYTATTKLKYQYSGKEFLKDGIGEVTLVTKVDGDTAHFKSKSGTSGTIKGRYNCIDTPESTGMLEPWGHGASEYNGKLLSEAKHIVLSTDKADATSGPAIDSTGGRYLVYVWVTTVENPTLDDFINVNLAICQEGYSKAKGVSSKEYADAFIDADAQAKAFKLHLWSDELDPDFNYDDPVKIDLRMIVEGFDSKGEKYNWVGSKVTFEAYVAGCGPDQGAAYVCNDITWTDTSGTHTQRYGMYIFTQYIVYAPLQTIGNYLEISGTVSEYNGTLQVVDVSYSAYYPDDYDIKIISTGNEDKVKPATGSAGTFASDKYVNTMVTVDLVCTGGYATLNTATSTAYAFTLYCHDKNNASESLNIRIADSISIKYPGTMTRIQDCIPFWKGEKSISEAINDGKNTDSRKLEYITITGAVVKYITTTGKTTYQVNLTKKADLTLHMSEE